MWPALIGKWAGTHWRTAVAPGDRNADNRRRRATRPLPKTWGLVRSPLQTPAPALHALTVQRSWLLLGADALAASLMAAFRSSELMATIR